MWSIRGRFIKREGDTFFSSSFLYPCLKGREMAGALAAFGSMRMRTKSERWQRNKLESAWGSDNFLEQPYLSQAAYFHTSFERERNKLSYLGHYHLKMYCFMQSVLIPIGTLANLSNVSFHCLPLALGHHCLSRESPPPCLHLFKSCPSFGGWIKSPLPHETCLPLPPLNSGAARLSPLLGYLAYAACTVIHPPAQSSGLSRPTCTFSKSLYPSGRKAFKTKS